jgi:molybdate transport system substrate-binding protein
MAAPLRIVSSMATRPVLAELVAAWNDEAGVGATLESVGGVDAARRVRAGEAFDVVILASDAIDALLRDGQLVGERVDLVRSGIAVAVREGDPRPDLGSEDAVRRAVSQAASVSYSTGPSGVYLASLFERWGIAQAVASRTVQAPPGVPVASLVAQGKVALGFQQLAELMNVNGIDIVGPLPPSIQLVTTFSGAVAAASKRGEAARDLLAFLASPLAGDAKRRHGMAPA